MIMPMKNPRINNWKQAFGVVLLCNAALAIVLCVLMFSWQLAGLAAFSFVLGYRLWTLGSEAEARSLGTRGTNSLP